MNITYAKYVNQIGILTTTASASFLNIKIDNGELMSVPISTDNIHYVCLLYTSPSPRDP